MVLKRTSFIIERLFPTNLAKHLAGKALSTSFVLGAGILAAFLLQILFARILGTEEYGLYAFVYSIISLSVVPMRFGLDKTSVRFLPIYAQENRHDKTAALLVFSACLCLACLVICILAAAFLQFEKPASITHIDLVTAALLILPIWSAFEICLGLLRSQRKVIIAGIYARAAISVLAAGIFLGLYYFKPNANTAFFAIVAFGLATSTMFLIAIISTWSALTLKVDFSAMKRSSFFMMDWVKMAVPMTLNSIVQVGFARIDVILVGLILGPVEAGLMMVASRIAQLVSFGLNTINPIATTRISEAFSGDKETNLQEVLNHSALIIFLFTLPIFLGLILLGLPLLHLFGSTYTSAYPALIILTLGHLVNAWTGPAATTLVMGGAPQKITIALSVATALNLAVSFALIPVLGIIGAAIGTASALIIKNVISIIMVSRKFHVDPTGISVLRGIGAEIRRLAIRPHST